MGAGDVVAGALVKALDVQAPLARKNCERLRRVSPDATPAELSARVTKYYLNAVTVSGGVAGGVSVVPGAGIASAGIDAVSFLEATVLYVLTMAEIHELHSEDAERRALLVRTVLIGDSAVTALGKATQRTSQYWGKQIVSSIPMTTVKQVNKVLGPRFVTKYGTKTGVIVLGKQVPFGIGAGLGAGANHLVARSIIKQSRKVLGPPPATFATATG
ncbi:hypothetical protein [Janibacter indicus]|uniref:hypothetical protein n=1 Tax=Janibacter indicus TaxID=857417 RepID=UPI003D9A2072